MQRAQLLALAGAIQAIRNDWDHSGIVSQLTKLNNNWTGTDAALATHVIGIAANNQAITPGALNAIMPPTAKTTAPTPGIKEERCFICGNPRSKCEELNDFEKRHGLPDPHTFETAQDAENNSSRATRTRKLEAIAALAQSKSIPT